MPADLVPLPALPLTRHGKVDRRALPRPERAPADRPGGQVAPRDELEARLVEIWQEALGAARVGVTDSFFDLGRQIPFYGLQAPEPDAGEPPPATIEELARRHLASVRGLATNGPRSIGGWSMGAAVAFEMARQLAGEGAPLARVVLIDPPLPASGGRERLDDAILTAWFVEHLRILGIDLARGRGELLAMAPEEVLRLACVQAGPAAPRERELAESRLRGSLDLIRSNGRALLRYRPEPYAGRLVIFSAERRSARDLLAAWQPLAAGGIELHRVAGDHYSMLRPPHVAALADRLRRCLPRSRRRQAAGDCGKG